MRKATGQRRRSAGRGNQQPCPHCRGTGFVTMCDEAKLIRAIALFAGDRTFNTNELMNYAMLVEGPLRATISTMSSVQLGKALRSMLDKNFAGFEIERQGADNAGARWRVFFRE